jgi:hypothetical protein
MPLYDGITCSLPLCHCLRLILFAKQRLPRRLR